MGTRSRIAGALVVVGVVLATGCAQSGTTQSAGRATGPPSAGPFSRANPPATPGSQGTGASAPRHRMLRRGAEVTALR